MKKQQHAHVGEIHSSSTVQSMVQKCSEARVHILEKDLKITQEPYEAARGTFLPQCQENVTEISSNGFGKKDLR